jgi:hypothetical protein
MTTTTTAMASRRWTVVSVVLAVLLLAYSTRTGSWIAQTATAAELAASVPRDTRRRPVKVIAAAETSDDTLDRSAPTATDVSEQDRRRPAAKPAIAEPEPTGPTVPVSQLLAVLSRRAGCPDEYWQSAPLEEQAPVPHINLMFEHAATPTTQTFTSFKRILAVITLTPPGDLVPESEKQDAQQRAELWATYFDRSYVVGADVKTFLMSCNAGNFPNLVACAAHTLIHDGAAYGALVVLDATLKGYDTTVCAIAAQLRAELDGTNSALEVPNRFMLDTEPMTELDPSEVCMQHRMSIRVQGHLSKSSVDAKWRLPASLAAAESVDELRALHWYRHRHRLKALVVPAHAFKEFFKSAAEWLFTDAPTYTSIVPFVEMLAAGTGLPLMRLDSGSSFTLGHVQWSTRDGGDPGKHRLQFDALQSKRPWTTVYARTGWLTSSIPATCKLTGRKNALQAIPASDHNGFHPFSPLPTGPWVYPRVAVADDLVSKRDTVVHAEVGRGLAAQEIPAMRYTKKGGGPESPESVIRIDVTGAQLKHAQPLNWSHVNFFPPVIVISMKFPEIYERPFIRTYIASLEKNFRRVVIVTSKVVKGLNDRFAPFPRQCLDGLGTTGCMMHLMRTRLVRHSGGIMFYHIDAFIYPHDFLGGGRTRDLLISTRHQYFGGHPDAWVFWPDHISSDMAGKFPENGYMPWNRGIKTFGSFFREYRQENEMFRKTQEARHNNFADIFYVPSRAFDVALEILDYHFPYYTPFEGFIGYWASMIKSLSTTRHNSFLHQGCCCCGSDGEIPYYPAGHKTTPADKRSVEAKTKRIEESFDGCQSTKANIRKVSTKDTMVLDEYLGPIEHIYHSRTVQRFFATKSKPHYVHPVLDEGTCRTSFVVTIDEVTAKQAVIPVLIVVPLANKIEVTVDVAPGMSPSVAQTIRVYCHCPNVNQLSITLADSVPREGSVLEVALRTGVATETPVFYGGTRSVGSKGGRGGDGDAVDAKGTRVPSLTLDELADAFSFSTPGARSADVVVDTADHMISEVDFVVGSRDGPGRQRKLSDVTVKLLAIE